MRSAPIWKSLALSAVSLIVTLVALEFVLRMTHLFGARPSWATPDSRLGFRYAPDSRYWVLAENDHPITGTINGHGWRDRHWTHTKPEGTFRVAVLGDSFVEAFQVEEDSTFLTIAERGLLDRYGLRVELMNFGRSGFTLTEELIVLTDEVAQFDPDIIAVFFFPGNDIADVRAQTATNTLRPFYEIDGSGGLTLDTTFVRTNPYRVRELIDGLKRNSSLLSLVTELYNEIRSRGSPRSLREELADGYLSLCTDSPDREMARSYNLARRLVSHMADWVEARNKSFLLVTVDDPTHVPRVAERLADLDRSFDPSCFEAEMGRLADAQGFRHVGLQSAFREQRRTDDRTLHWGEVGHWNYRGHRTVAEALIPELAANLASEVGESGGAP